jgi:hypothetical protein
LLPAAIGVVLVVMPGLVSAQTQRRVPHHKPSTAPPAEASVEGLPIYTSDGKAIGKVIAMGLDEDNKPVLVGEIERQLGFGPMAIAVPLDMFVRKDQRIELTITEAEVTSRLNQ